jgi:putative transposase
MSVEQSENRSLSLLCSLLGYSRQAYYKRLRLSSKVALKEELLLQQTVRVRKLQKRLGCRKLLHKLVGFMQQHGILMGRDAFFNLLRKHNLLVRKRKRKKPQTTFSQHGFRKYPNRIADFVASAANQLWVCDITYICIKEGFSYLSLVTDAYSRKIVGFYLSVNLAAKGCIYALQQALKDNPNTDNLIHHSDRGLQYCSLDYIKLLQKNGIKISMTQSGDPLENALAERVNGILKEELLQSCFTSFDQAQQAVAVAITIYNHQRPHSSLNMLTPAVAHTLTGTLKKHWKNYYSIHKQKEVTMT